MIKANVCSATNPTALPRKLKIAPMTLSTMADNASIAVPTILREHLLACSTTFLKPLYLLVGMTQKKQGLRLLQRHLL